MEEIALRVHVSFTLGHLGIALLAFAPVAYRLRRASRPGQFVVGGTVVLAAGQWTDVTVLLKFVGTSIEALATVIFIATLLGVTLLGWPRRRHGSLPVCALEAGALGTAAHLLGDVVAQVNPSVTYPKYQGAYDGGAYDVAMVTATPADVNLTLLLLGAVAVVFALGHARIHGPLRAPPESGERIEARPTSTSPR